MSRHYYLYCLLLTNLVLLLGVVVVSGRGLQLESPKSILSRRLKDCPTSPMRIPRGGSTEEEEEVVMTMAADHDENVTENVHEQELHARSTSFDTTSTTTTFAEDDDTSLSNAHNTDERFDHDRDAALEESTELRRKGKELHDDGDYFLAAEVFSQAADLLEEADDHQVDYCTCRLHEALCRLKADEFESCIDVCTSLLDKDDIVSGAIRARALHRRAKAYLHLGQFEEALADARAAAFLGDSKAVALYGTLMRGSSGTTSTSTTGGHGGNAPFDDSLSSPMLNDLLHGKNPFLSSADSVASSPMLLQSLLGKSNPMMSRDAPSLLGQGGSGGTLAKSLLSSLTKRLENDSDSICEYLQKTNPTQIQTLGSMAGVPISQGQAKRLVQFCHGLTPKSIRRTVRYGKRAWYGITVIRKSIKVVNKYKHLLILWALLAWIQAAISRPIPLSRKAIKLATEAATKK